VIAGRKGSGKTLLMRRMREGYEGNLAPSRLIIDVEQTQLPTTRQIVSVSRLCPDSLLTETWQQIWGKSILLSLMSHFLLDRDFMSRVTGFDRDALSRDFADLSKYFTTEPRTPFTILKAFIVGTVAERDDAGSVMRLNRLLDDPTWDDLEIRLGRLMRSMPPIYVFIDAVDEEFAHAPMEWLRCQKGLFYELLRFLRHRALGERLHLVISIRDIVLHSVFKSEHSPRYMGDPRIRVLQWDREAAVKLLDHKAAHVERQFWLSGSRPKNFRDWVGFARVGTSEMDWDLYDYALGFTQNLPREIVTLGNLIGREIVDRGCLSMSGLMRASRNVGRLSALTQLEISANQLRASERMFWDSSGFQAEQEQADRRAQELLDSLADIGHSPVRANELNVLGRVGEAAGEGNAQSILWQNGLLGYRDEFGRDVYFSLDVRGRLSLPGAASYCLHPSLAALIDSSDGHWKRRAI